MSNQKHERAKKTQGKQLFNSKHTQSKMRRSLRNTRQKQSKCANCNDICVSNDCKLFSDHLSPDINNYARPKFEEIQTVDGVQYIKIEHESDEGEDIYITASQRQRLERRKRAVAVEQEPGTTVFDALFQIFKAHWESKRELLESARSERKSDFLLCQECFTDLSNLYFWFSKFTEKSRNSIPKSFLHSVLSEKPKPSPSKTNSKKAKNKKHAVSTFKRAPSSSDSYYVLPDNGHAYDNSDDEEALVSQPDETLNEGQVSVANFVLSTSDNVASHKEEINDASTHNAQIKEHRQKKKRIKKKQLIRPLKATCKPCKMVFQDCWKLRRHLKTKRHEENAVDFQSGEENEEQAMEEDEQLPTVKDEPTTNETALPQRRAKKSDSRTRKRRLFSCPDCGKSFRSFAIISSHTQKEHPLDFSCAFCIERFGDRRHYREHLNSSHEGEKTQTCGTCGKMFFSKSELTWHSRNHKGQLDIVCTICNATFSSEATRKAHLLSHTDSSKLPTFTCPECKKRFTNQKLLQVHVRYIHEMRNNYVCPQPGCEKSYAVASYLKTHMTSHSTFGTHLCNNCGKVYKHKKDLLNHERSAHAIECDNVKSFSCDVCSKVYHAAFQLRRHIVSAKHYAGGQEPEVLPPAAEADPMEVGPMKFVCPICQMQLVSDKALKVHSLIHNVEELGRLNFPCPQCGKMFSTLKFVREHIKRIHEAKHTCEICGKRFVKNYILQRHLLSHSDVQSHFCEECGKGYKFKRDMLSHYQKEHVGEHMLRFQCELCPRRFHSMYLVRTHTVIKHPESLSSIAIASVSSQFQPITSA